MKKYIYIFLGLIILGCNQPQKFNYYSNSEEINLELLQKQCILCLDQAEKTIFKPKPNIVPNDGTNPDPSKCICKGTGIIVQGDGHKTECPHHYKKK